MIKKNIRFECPICHKIFEGSTFNEKDLGSQYADHVIAEFDDLVSDLKRDGFNITIDVLKDRVNLHHPFYKEDNDLYGKPSYHI